MIVQRHYQAEPPVPRDGQARVGDPALCVNDIGTQLIDDSPERRDHSRIRYRRMERDVGPFVPARQSSTGPASHSLDPEPVDGLVHRSAGQVRGHDGYLVTAPREPLR